MGAQPQGQPANPNQWAVDLYNQYQGNQDQGVRDALTRQMQGQDMGKAFNQAMRGAGYSLNQPAAPGGAYTYTPPTPQNTAGSGAKPGMGQPAANQQIRTQGPNTFQNQMGNLANIAQQSYQMSPNANPFPGSLVSYAGNARPYVQRPMTK